MKQLIGVAAMGGLLTVGVAIQAGAPPRGLSAVGWRHQTHGHSDRN